MAAVTKTTMSKSSHITDAELAQVIALRKDKDENLKQQLAMKRGKDIVCCLEACGFTMIDAIAPKHGRTSCSDQRVNNSATVDCLRCVLIQAKLSKYYPYNLNIVAFISKDTDLE